MPGGNPVGPGAPDPSSSVDMMLDDLILNDMMMDSSITDGSLDLPNSPDQLTSLQDDMTLSDDPNRRIDQGSMLDLDPLDSSDPSSSELTQFDAQDSGCQTHFDHTHFDHTMYPFLLLLLYSLFFILNRNRI
jgi:hypothetical protein